METEVARDDRERCCARPMTQALLQRKALSSLSSC